MAKAKTYPDQTLEKAARAAGARVVPLWEMRGPRDTLVEWMVCYSINGRPVIVQTYKEGGWDVFSACNSIQVDVTIADALARCGVGTNQQAAA